MSEAGAPRRSPIPIGEVANPPFARLPDSTTHFRLRAQRFAMLAAALQGHFARLACRLDADRLVPVGDGVCPVCGGAPVASMVVGWQGAHGTRFCACSLCSTLWHVVRIKRVLCSSIKGISYREIEGGPAAGLVRAETCESCRCYVKILQQQTNPAFDPVADDAATLGLHLLLRDADYRCGAVNPFLLGC